MCEEKENMEVGKGETEAKKKKGQRNVGRQGRGGDRNSHREEEG